MTLTRWLSTSVLLLSVATRGLHAQEAFQDVENKIAPTVNQFRKTLVQKNAEGRELTVAIIPLIDAEKKRVPRLGVTIAEIVERHLLAGKPEWLRVQSRLNIGEIMEEQKLWITDLVRGKQKENGASTGFLEKADFLVVGAITPGATEVMVELRLIATKDGNVLNAQFASFPISPTIRELLRYLRRDAADKIEDVAPVSDLRLEVTAQREGVPGAPVKQWAMQEGETLKGGSDQFKIRFSTNADASVYIFLYGSGRQAVSLFPAEDWEALFERQFGRKAKPQDEYCRIGLDYTVPNADTSQHQRFFKLDTIPGTNTIYVCANHSEVNNYQDIAERLTKAGTAEKRLQILTDTFRFDYVKTFSFNQEGGK